MTVEKILYYISAVLGIVAALAAVALMLMGMPSAFGESMNVLIAFRMIVDLFSYTDAKAYRALVGAVMGVVYFITVILLMKCVVVQSQQFKKLQSNNYLDVEDGFRKSMQMTVTSFVYSSMYLVLTNLLLEQDFSLLGKLNMAAGAVAVLFAHIAKSIGDYDHAIDRVVYALRGVFTVAMSCILLITMMQPTGRQLIFGFKMFFEGGITFNGGFLNFLYALYEHLLVYAAGMVLLWLCYSMIISALENPDGYNYWSRYLTGAISVSVGMIILHFVLGGLLVYDLRHFTVDMFYSLFLSIKDFLLPVFLILVSMLFVYPQFDKI